MNERKHKSVDEIEREIRETEADIERTLDLIQHKVSPGAVVDTLLRSSRENGAEFAANFGRSVRDNPLPITLIGTGLAWLMLSYRGNGRDHQKLIGYSAHPDSHEESQREREDASRIYREGADLTGEGESEGYASARNHPGVTVRAVNSEADHGASTIRGSVEHGMSDLRDATTSAASGASAAARRAEERAREAARSAQERAHSLGDRATASARGARSAAEDAYSGARSAAEDAYSGARSAAGEAYSGARSTAEEAYSGARSTVERAYSGARAAGEHATERMQAGGEAAYRRSSELAHRTTARASEAASAIGSSLREHPIFAGAVLAGIGALVGALLPSTRREDALLGEHSDAVKAQAVDAAEHQAERVRTVAVAAAEGARREAEERGLTPKAVAETAEEEIRRVAEAGREVARAAMREGEAAAKGESPQNEEKEKGEQENEESRKEQSEDEGKPGTGSPYSRIQAAPLPPGPSVPPVTSRTTPEVTPPATDQDPLNREK